MRVGGWSYAGKGNHMAQVALYAQVDQIAPSPSPHTWQGLFQMSHGQRGGAATHLFLKGVF